MAVITSIEVSIAVKAFIAAFYKSVFHEIVRIA